MPNESSSFNICFMNLLPLVIFSSLLLIDNTGLAILKPWPVTLFGLLSSAPKKLARKSLFIHRGDLNNHLGTIQFSIVLFPAVEPRQTKRLARALEPLLIENSVPSNSTVSYAVLIECFLFLLCTGESLKPIFVASFCISSKSSFFP